MFCREPRGGVIGQEYAPGKLLRDQERLHFAMVQVENFPEDLRFGGRVLYCANAYQIHGCRFERPRPMSRHLGPYRVRNPNFPEIVQ